MTTVSTPDMFALAFQMAEAGFYFVGSDDDPDLARCYYCRRELGGWEPEDDPWAEHKRRPCPFIDLGKVTSKLTREDLYKLECEKNCHVVVSESAKFRPRPLS